MMSERKQHLGFFAGILTGVLVATIGFAFFVKSQNQKRSAMFTGDQGDGGASGQVLALKLAHSLDTQHPVVSQNSADLQLIDVQGRATGLRLVISAEIRQ